MEDTAKFIRIQRAVAGLFAGLVLVMAMLAGRGLFLGDGFDVHGYIGNAAFTVALVNLLLTVKTARTGFDFGFAVVLMGLTFAQVGLGYVGRESAEAASWHVPNGVLIMALASFQYADLRNRVAVAVST